MIKNSQLIAAIAFALGYICGIVPRSLIHMDPAPTNMTDYIQRPGDYPQIFVIEKAASREEIK